MEEVKEHKAGFVSLVGKPNVGKSTLMNVLMGESLSIITPKAQTTRHRIQGIISGDDYQIVYSDTPGIIEPKYKLHENMMSFVSQSLEDADVILFITDIYEKHDEDHVIARLNKVSTPIFVLVNKIDQVKAQSEVMEKMEYWKEKFPNAEIIPISALEKFNTEVVFDKIMDLIPVHPAYFDKDSMTDKPERFFVSEIVREKIFLNYRKEVPYSCEVLVTGFQEEEDIIRVRVEILVERESQRSIIIGQKGEAIKKLGIDSRRDLEAFFKKQFFIQTFVKVEKDWRKNVNALRKFGYEN